MSFLHSKIILLAALKFFFGRGFLALYSDLSMMFLFYDSSRPYDI